MEVLAILLALVVFIVYNGIFTVKQQTFKSVERFGKFSKEMAMKADIKLFNEFGKFNETDLELLASAKTIPQIVQNNIEELKIPEEYLEAFESIIDNTQIDGLYGSFQSPEYFKDYISNLVENTVIRFSMEEMEKEHIISFKKERRRIPKSQIKKFP